MSAVISSLGSARNSSHVHSRCSSTSPTTVNVHCSSGVRGVGPAESTGESGVTYWPGGTRSRGPPSRRPRKPRETIGGMALSLSQRHRVTSAPSGAHLRAASRARAHTAGRASGPRRGTPRRLPRARNGDRLPGARSEALQRCVRGPRLAADRTRARCRGRRGRRRARPPARAERLATVRARRRTENVVPDRSCSPPVEIARIYLRARLPRLSQLDLDPLSSACAHASRRSSTACRSAGVKRAIYVSVYSGPEPPSGGVSRPPFAVIAPHWTQFEGVTWTRTVSFSSSPATTS